MIVEDLSSQSSGIFNTRYDKKNEILGLIFPK